MIITITVSKQPTEDLNMKLTDAYKAQEAIKRHESFFQLEISTVLSCHIEMTAEGNFWKIK